MLCSHMLLSITLTNDYFTETVYVAKISACLHTTSERLFEIAVQIGRGLEFRDDFVLYHIMDPTLVYSKSFISVGAQGLQNFPNISNK